MDLLKSIKEQFKGDNNSVEDNNLPWTNTEDTKDNSPNKLSTKKLASLGLIALIAIIMCVALFNYFTKQNSVSIEKNDNASEENNIQIQVHVAGEVNKPGVYKLDAGSRIMDAVNAAGGFTSKADQNSLNLAKVLEDGEQILINSTEPASNPSTSDSNSSSSNNGKVNINTADLATLQTLSGVGPSTAQKIIDYRNANGKFKTIEDLKKVSGIGEKTFEKFKDKICV